MFEENEEAIPTADFRVQRINPHDVASPHEQLYSSAESLNFDSSKLISMRRASLLEIAPEVLVDQIGSKHDDFWLSHHFEDYDTEDFEDLIEDELCYYATITGCYLIAPISFGELIMDGTVFISGGASNASCYTTPQQQRQMEKLLEQVVGPGQFCTYRKEWCITTVDGCSDVDIAVAVPLTHAAAETMRSLQRTGKFFGLDMATMLPQ